jgi:DNA-directed RNA polymerase subunit beta
VAEGLPNLEPHEIRGMDAEEILNAFYGQVVFSRNDKGWSRPFDPEAFRGVKLAEDLVDARTGQVVSKAGDKLTPRTARKIAEAGTTEVLVGRTDLLGRYVAEDMVNMQTGEIWAEAGEELTETRLTAIEEAGLDRLPTLAIDQSVGPWIRSTLAVDKNTNREEALMDIYRVMRPGEPPTPRPPRRCSAACSSTRALRPVGRRPGEDEHAPRLLRRGGADTIRTLRKQDIVATMRVLLELKDGAGRSTTSTTSATAGCARSAS